MDKKSKRNEVPHLCMVTFTTNVRNHATKCAFDLPHPKLTNAIWGAGLSFAKCHAELKVPVDPYTAGIFDGEVFNRYGPQCRTCTHAHLSFSIVMYLNVILSFLLLLI